MTWHICPHKDSIAAVAVYKLTYQQIYNFLVILLHLERLMILCYYEHTHAFPTVSAVKIVC